MIGHLAKRYSSHTLKQHWLTGPGSRPHRPLLRSLRTNRSSKSAAMSLMESPALTLRTEAQMWKGNVLTSLRTLPKRRPFGFSLLLSASFVPLADFMVQRSEGRRWDRKRTACFCLFGFYQGLACWGVYVTIFSRLFPKAAAFANLSLAQKLKDGAGLKQLFGQVCTDLFLYMPAVYFPVFYFFKAFVNSEPLNSAVQKWQHNFFTDNTTSMGFWFPGDALIFAVPMWMRMPVSHVVSFSWNSILSWMRGANTK